MTVAAEIKGSIWMVLLANPRKKRPIIKFSVTGISIIPMTDTNTSTGPMLICRLVHSRASSGARSGVSMAEIVATLMDSVMLFPERQATMPEEALLG